MNEMLNWNFVLSQTDERAMYQQIMDQVQQHVAVGDLRPGAKLPSIRELAVTLKVSVITVKRAYLELEREGTIVTQHGRGSWVAEEIDLHGLKKSEVERHLGQAAKLAASMNVTPEELVTMLKKQTTD